MNSITTFEKKRLEEIYNQSVLINDKRDNQLQDLESEAINILGLLDGDDYVFDMIYNNQYDVENIMQELDIKIEYDENI